MTYKEIERQLQEYEQQGFKYFAIFTQRLGVIDDLLFKCIDFTKLAEIMDIEYNFQIGTVSGIMEVVKG